MCVCVCGMNFNCPNVCNTLQWTGINMIFRVDVWFHAALVLVYVLMSCTLARASSNELFTSVNLCSFRITLQNEQISSFFLKICESYSFSSSSFINSIVDCRWSKANKSTGCIHPFHHTHITVAQETLLLLIAAWIHWFSFGIDNSITFNFAYTQTEIWRWTRK